jgi:RNA polymerase sigma factor (sigma-70 family)
LALRRILQGVAHDLQAGGPMALNLLGVGTVLHRETPRGADTQPSTTKPVDEILLARAQRGNEAALEALFRHFEAPVYTLARRLTRTPHDAEDVLQETFLEVVRSIKRFRREGSFEGWIRRVAASKALMRLRAQASRVPEEELSDELADAVAARGDHSAIPIATAPERVDLQTALARLPNTARTVIWLHDVEGYSHEEIAAMAGKTASFSKSQLARAHARLREMLDPRPEGPCT